MGRRQPGHERHTLSIQASVCAASLKLAVALLYLCLLRFILLLLARLLTAIARASCLQPQQPQLIHVPRVKSCRAIVVHCAANGTKG